VRHLDLRGLTIMGQDWGGPIGLSVAARSVERLRALVMGNTWYWPTDDWKAKAFSYALSMAPMQSLVVNNNLFVERIMPLGVKHRLADDVMHHYREAMPTPASRAGVAELPRQILEAAAWLGDLEDAVRERLANVPLLLTWGVHDPMFGARYMERFREDFRVVEVRRLDARHYIQEDAPGEIAAAIAAFLDSPRARAAS
jgi:haloalkane dehalogenase